MRVLIITYYWPPSGGGGVQRWFKLSKYLPAYGIEPVIYTPLLSRPPHRDDSLLEEEPQGLQVWRRKIFDPFELLARVLPKAKSQSSFPQGFLPHAGMSILQRLAVWVRANCFIPDSRICWLRPSVRYLQRRLKEQPVQLIISTGPPHSTHLIALRLAKRLHLPWWADFRDCWTRWEMLLELKPLPWVLGMHQRMESRVLKACTVALTVSKQWAADFQAAGARQTFVLYNGYDAADLAFSSPKPSPVEAKKFRLMHLGVLTLRRSEALWQVLAELCTQKPSLASALEIVLGGVIEKQLAQRLAKDSVLGPRVKYLGYVPHKEVFAYYQTASLLLLFPNLSPSMKGQIPGKFFECLAAQRPVFALTLPDSELATLVKEQEAGVVVPYYDPYAIRQGLLQGYEAHINPKTSFTPRSAAAFSRKHQAQHLAQALIQSTQSPS